jgi:acylphosphatase
MMEFFTNNKNVLFGLIAAIIVGVGIVHWTGFTDGQAQKTDVEVAIDNLADKNVEEVVVVAEKPDFTEKVNEAAVNNQVNAAQKLSDDTDGLSEK